MRFQYDAFKITIYWCPVKIKTDIKRCLNRRFNAVEILFFDLQAPLSQKVSVVAVDF